VCRCVRFCYWKIVVMGFKAVLIVIMIFLESKPLAQNISALVIQAA
jgi:hypothetical protein